MKLSVIIPYYNTNATIGQALDSLLDQDLEASEYEIIVVDDGSTEEPVVLKDYAHRFPQVRYHRLAHAGLSPARNYALSVARGDWLYLCDSDDYVQPQVFGGIIAAAEANRLEMICARVKETRPGVPAAGTPRRNFAGVSAPQTGLDYLANPPAPICTGVWQYLLKRSVLDSTGLSFPKLFYVEDRLFLYDLLPKVSRMAHIDVDLYCFVQRPASILHARMKNDCRGYADAMLLYLNKLNALISDPATPPLAAQSLRNRRDYDAYVILINVFRYASVKDTAYALRCLASLAAYPLKLIGSGRVLQNRKLMNRPTLWTFLCRVFHLLPFGVRVLT